MRLLVLFTLPSQPFGCYRDSGFPKSKKLGVWTKSKSMKIPWMLDSV